MATPTTCRFNDPRCPVCSVRASCRFTTVGLVTEVLFEGVAPVLTVRDLADALARYRRLGFTTELDESAQYGFVRRGRAQLHLVPEDENEPSGTGGVIYMYVSDANALHAEWTSAGVEGRFMGPHDTPYALREFVYTDPDGIVHRVGSPMTTT